MATLVVFRDGKLGALIGIESGGVTLGLGSEGHPTALPSGQPGGILHFTPRGEGMKVSRLPGAPEFTVNDTPSSATDPL